jgi:DNA-binding response OmpR family regulator
MKRILVIEDNNEVRENIAELLELSNYEVISAPDGKVGVQKALESKPDLILCDVMMPELDGFGVLRILEKKVETADIPFIFLTARAEKADFRKGMSLGADDYITKPFDDVELLDAIEMRLKKSERIKTSFDGSFQGLNAFINEARGQKELENLSKEREIKRYRKKEVIYNEGDYPKRLFFVVEGKVKVYKTNELGKEYIVEIMKEGDFLGYHSLIKDENYFDSAAAMEDSLVSYIPKEDFFLLLHGSRDFSAHFVKMLADNVLDKEERLLSLAYNSIRKRVAETLVALHEKEGKNQFSILRDDLAGLVGTAKESVIRTLTDFKQEGLIDIQNGTITILNVNKLARIPN